MTTSETKTRSLNPHGLGHLYEDEHVVVFFGDRRSTREAVADEFSSLRIITIKQTHSDIVIRSPFDEPAPEADAHYSDDTNLALCIRTADCTPVLLHDPVSGFIAAIHAGWRGVENEIVINTCESLKKAGADLTTCRAWCGPHIAEPSFEVGLDVATKLESAFKRVAGFSSHLSSLREHHDPEKARVSLKTIVRAQLISKGILPQNITELSIDTFTSPRHESHRRDREKSSRQISFIALKR
jgi:YfiH family protein